MSRFKIPPVPMVTAVDPHAELPLAPDAVLAPLPPVVSATACVARLPCVLDGTFALAEPNGNGAVKQCGTMH